MDYLIYIKTRKLHFRKFAVRILKRKWKILKKIRVSQKVLKYLVKQLASYYLGLNKPQMLLSSEGCYVLCKNWN